MEFNRKKRKKKESTANKNMQEHAIKGGLPVFRCLVGLNKSERDEISQSTFNGL